jgi:metallo-beta-lactamase family protein
MKLSFHGADREVTGSCHLIECLGRRILIDCGMRQGSRELVQENAEPFGFDPAAIDVVLLTHAHLDHCGRLPLLAKRGFRGEIVATAATRELASLVIADAAHLQEEEARRESRHQRRRGNDSALEPLYSLVDGFAALGQFGRAATYGAPIALAPGIRATFFDAGHILGSASILVEITEEGRTRSVFFSGDIGNAGRPLLRPPTTAARADFIVMESTYGDRAHRPMAASVDELYTAITETFARGGNVIIPTFALERAQEILYVLHKGIETSKVPASAQVFLDSPMAISATEVFKHHPDCLEPIVASMFQKGLDPFRLPNLRLTRETADSVAINRITDGAIIMAGAGMCTGGRIRHHLRHNLWRHECSVVFVGFAAVGTPARRIIDGTPSVTLLGEDIPVKAVIHTINGFSAHADQQELVTWHRRISGNEVTFIVHGEMAAMTNLAAKLAAPRVAMPGPNQLYNL